MADGLLTRQLKLALKDGVGAARGARSLVVMAVWVVCGLSACVAQDPGWLEGRATYFGAPEAVSRAYDPARGEGSFGILAYGSCGYTNIGSSGGTLPYPRDAVAASADANSDYPGSCSRCYEIRCRSGPVLSNSRQPIKIVYGVSGQPPSIGYFDGDKWRPYLPSINPNVTDENGRPFPGNPGEADNQIVVQCYDEAKSLRVRVIDSCPCTQVLKEGAPGVKAGGETRRQEWCCGPVTHFDISYWAMQQLAHPVTGAIMLNYRPVDCDTGAPVPPNIISPVLYSSTTGIGTGWGWMPYKSNSAVLTVQGPTPTPGSKSTCINLQPKGSISFFCRECYRPGFQPLAGKTSFNFWIRPDNGQTATVPPLKLFLIQAEVKGYCRSELNLGSSINPSDSSTVGGREWSLFTIPLSEFGCGGSGYPSLAQIDKIEFENEQTRDVAFCITQAQLV
ncbi:hypothetical protein V8C86DRAFT_2468022 [Haematococcus lacustris]